jgi:hypothetical protein
MIDLIVNHLIFCLQLIAGYFIQFSVIQGHFQALYNHDTSISKQRSAAHLHSKSTTSYQDSVVRSISFKKGLPKLFPAPPRAFFLSSTPRPILIVHVPLLSAQLLSYS